MPRFAYPNVQIVRSDKFLGCGRYLFAEQQPSERYNAPHERSRIDEIDTVHAIASHFHHEAQQAQHYIYEWQDDPSESYKGNSKHIAYLLALLSSIWKVKLNIRDDIWCTGELSFSHEGRPQLNTVKIEGFDGKMQHFLAEENPDRLFIVPADNFAIWASKHNGDGKGRVVSFHTIHQTIQDDPVSKLILPVKFEELLNLLEAIFDLPDGYSPDGSLTWKRLQAICSDITQHRIATVMGKYQANLYLQREKIYETFTTFLKSEKKCFILVGKSGVGKSNFLLSLLDEFQHISNNQHAILMYDGANLSVEPSCTEVITSDVNERLNKAEQPIKNIWHTLKRIHDIEAHSVLLYIDAINENPQATELLRQINELIQKPYPWLKVICSSRPETWNAVKRGVRLAEKFYYREEGTEAIGVELKPFTYSEQIEPFSKQELPIVYAKYQKIFDIQTEYEDLRNEQRELLRDPLNLWLIAHIYQNRPIPSTLHATELIGQYVDALLASGRLTIQDRTLLETRIIPFMIQDDHYCNAINVADIHKIDRELYELIYQDDILDKERIPKYSFLNLLDTDILSRQMEGNERKIAFKYERFYDYFVGNALFEHYRNDADSSAFLERLVTDFQKNLFLWGALRQVFIHLFEEGCYTQIEQLGRTNNDFQANLLASVISENYQQYHHGLDPILLKWLEKEYMETRAPIIAANIALTCQIETLIEYILVHQNKEVRYIAIQNIHELWKANPDVTTNILLRLPHYVSIFIPRRSYNLLNTLLYVSIFLVLADYSNVGPETQTFSVVQRTWEPIIKKFLLVSQNKLFERGLKRVRRWLSKLVSTIGLNFLEGIQREGFPFFLEDVHNFFPANERNKQIIRYLSRHFDVCSGEVSETVEELGEYIAMLARNGENNSIIFWAAELALIAHIKNNPQRTIQVLDKLLSEIYALYPPTKIQNEPTAMVWTTLPNIFMTFPYKQMTKEDVRPILLIQSRIINIIRERYLNRYRLENGTVKVVNRSGWVLYGYYFDMPEFGHELLREIVQCTFKQGDYILVGSVIPVLAIIAVRQDMPEPAIEAIFDYFRIILHPSYMERFDKHLQDKFWDMVISVFSQARVIEKYQPYILDLLERLEDVLPESVLVQVRGHNRRDYMAFHIGEAAFRSWIRSLHDPNPMFRSFLKWLFYTVSEVKNLTEFVREVIIYWVDLLYPGESVFSKKLPPQSPHSEVQ